MDPRPAVVQVVSGTTAPFGTPGGQLERLVHGSLRTAPDIARPFGLKLR